MPHSPLRSPFISILSRALSCALALGAGACSSSNGGPSGSGGSGSGGSGRINLFASLSGRLSQPQVTNYVRVRTNEPDPFYLRFGVADVLTKLGLA